MNIEKWEFKKMPLSLMHKLSDEFIRDIQVSHDDILEMTILKMTKDIIAHKCGDRIIRHPENWKESVKERWLPRWAKKRWPIRYKEYDALVIFPQFLKHHPVPPPCRGENFYISYIEHGSYGQDENPVK
jgi:hypothetical protein